MDNRFIEDNAGRLPSR